MARTRKPLGRGSRFISGKMSGVTYVTNPSGVTIDQYAVVTPSGYPVANATNGKICVSGVSYWAGTTVSLVTGLSSIDALMATIINDGAGTYPLSVVTYDVNTVAGYASAALNYNPQGAGASLATLVIAPGCSIAFMAFGT